jgi:glucans biosynthesis protein
MARHTSLTLLALLASARAFAFGFEDVDARAKALAATSYSPPREAPQFIREVGYDQYRGMRFQTGNNLWADDRSRFQVTPVMPGGVYRIIVPINVVDGDAVTPLAFRKEHFKYDEEELAGRIPDDLGYAGFELSYPLTTRNVQDKFLVFAGASYFRVIAAAAPQWGLSARGAAIDTGVATGEEFPDFVEYWLVRPSRDASRMTIYALLDGPRLSGAFEFVVAPGTETALDVRAVLYTRASIALLGIAPLTSMYYYGENAPRPRGAWRPEVHDSDGLAVRAGGESLWRPLLAPPGVQSDAFAAAGIESFGLFQRDTSFASYEDPGARYDRRPSALVETRAGFDDGRVVLVQLPTNNEYMDNVVAFWAAPGAVEAGARLEHRYRLRFGPPAIAGATLAQVTHTFVGRDLVGADAKAGSFRVIVDFAGGRLGRMRESAAVSADVDVGSGGQVIERQLERIEATGEWRLSMLARPAGNAPLTLRAVLRANGEALTETWDYLLPVGVAE